MSAGTELSRWGGVLAGLRTHDARTVIEPRQPGPIARLREFWAYRRLVPPFAQRLIRKMYMRTFLGKLWVPLRPVLNVGSQILFFGGFLGVPSAGVPYAIFFLTGTTSWQFFSHLLYWSTRSIDLNRRYLRRIYIPRLVLLASAMAPAALWWAMYAVITVLVVLYFGIFDGNFYVSFGVNTLLFPAGMLLIVMLAYAFGMWTSVVGARYRDVRFSLKYILNFWSFATPIVYPLQSLPKEFQPIALYNPLTAPVEMVKRGLLGSSQELHLTSLWVCLGTILVVGVGGFVFFSRSESSAMDSL